LLLDDAEASILLTDRSLWSRLSHSEWGNGVPHSRPRPQDAVRIVYCDEGSGSGVNLGPAAQPGNLAYVLYTSGSTGKPKGVEILHSSVVNFLESMRQVHAFTAADRLLAVTTISFDIAMIDVFLPLVNGGRLCLATLEDSRDPVRLVELMRQTSPTVMNATPATWRALIEAGWPGDRNLRIMCGGEAMARDLARQLLARCAVLWNGYGPTETTIGSAFHKVSAGAGPVPIGQPIANTQMYVLDHRRRLVPVGVKGDLYIGGAGLARGYRGRPELTRECFVEAPSVTSARLYRTGDLARWLPDGSLECLGRADNQLKIRGFRVEPEEIEAALLEHPEVCAAAVKAWPDASGHLSLAAYVVAPSRPGVREFLERQLPQYMVPPRVVWMENLPLNENGKVDRGRLPEPVSVVASVGYVAPSGETERRLASIWEAVLERKGIGTHDNFFDLGGHSLIVAKLLRQVETEFGVRLSLAAVFQAPTIEQFAGLLRSQRTARKTSKLLKLQNAGSRPPLYWMHAGPAFRELAAHLGENRPFFGVAPDPDEEAALPEHPSMAQIAACLVRTIRAEQPEGPYLLGGWCASGLVAYEAASQLMAAGQEVPLLVLLDCLNPRYYFAISKLSLLASRFRYHIRNLTAQSARVALRYGIARFGALRDHFRPPQLPDQKLLSAMSSYDPKPYSGRVLLLQPDIHFDVCDVSPGWEGVLTGDVEFRAIPGNHVSWLEKSNVAELAARIKNSLESVGQQRLASPSRSGADDRSLSSVGLR
jgi:amino acid adenylation domain-containing protein